MTEQEDEEEKVKWRVDAEVKLAMEEFKAAESEHTAGTQGMTWVELLSEHDTLGIFSVCTVGTQSKTQHQVHMLCNLPEGTQLEHTSPELTSPELTSPEGAPPEYTSPECMSPEIMSPESIALERTSTEYLT